METHSLLSNLLISPVLIAWFSEETCGRLRRAKIINAFIGRLGVPSALRVWEVKAALASSKGERVNYNSQRHKQWTRLQYPLQICVYHRRARNCHPLNQRGKHARHVFRFWNFDWNCWDSMHAALVHSCYTGSWTWGEWDRYCLGSVGLKW